MPDEGCLCQGCGKRYRVDLVLPDNMWHVVRPKGKPEEGGLLCGRCIMDRLERLEDFGFLLVTEGSVGNLTGTRPTDP